jgi:hypothetical protein
MMLDIKLREASLTYNFGAKTLERLPFTASLSIIGRNLWIIDKNTPYADPEAGLSSGNSRLSIWCLPSIRNWSKS